MVRICKHIMQSLMAFFNRHQRLNPYEAELRERQKLLVTFTQWQDKQPAVRFPIF